MKNVLRWSRWFTLLVAFALVLGCSCAAVASGDYLKVVTDYADAMIDQGRDVYGKQTSPLYASTLDRKTGRLLVGPDLHRVQSIPRQPWGIRPSDRSLDGANPMHDQNLYQVLYALTTITGQARYAEEADKALEWLLTHCQSPQTGLLAWGEHLGWNFRTESPIKAAKGFRGGGIHEYFRPWVLWDRCWELSPEACETFARGVWNHQISDHQTGIFSRHACYDFHHPGTAGPFPRHGGFYIATWALAYEQTNNPMFLQATDTLVSFFGQRLGPQENSYLSLSIDIEDAADRVPPELASKLRDFARRIDQVHNEVHYKPLDLSEPDSLVEGAWVSLGYQLSTYASRGLMMFLRYHQAGSEALREAALNRAEVYTLVELDTGKFVVLSGSMGNAIGLLVEAFKVTGQQKYLHRADHFAQQAIDVFFDDTSPLPKACSHQDHYEAVACSDTLIMALLDLWAVKNNPDLKLDLVYTDR